MRASRWRAWSLATATLLLCLPLAGCNLSGDLDDAGLRELRGDVRIDGSSTVYPISEAAASAFRDEFPRVSVAVGQSGTGGGFKRFGAGETDICGASRPIRPEEFRQCKDNGVAFIELAVAFDGLSIVVNPENDWVDQLTVEQLKQIFLEAGAAKTWKEVDPSWPAEPIKIYSPGTDSGTFDYFVEVMGGGMRKDMSTSEDDNVLVTGIAGEQHAIGFFGCAYYYENQDKLKVVPIVNPDTGEAVKPDPKAVESGQYVPLSRPLFIYVREDSLKRPECRKFAEFYLQHAAELAEKVGYVRLPGQFADAARKHLDERLTGTHFVTESGESRPSRLTDNYDREGTRVTSDQLSD